MNRRKFNLISIVAIILWMAAIFYFSNNVKKVNPHSLGVAIQNSIKEKELSINSLLANHTLMDSIWADRLSVKQIEELEQVGFIIQMFSNGHLQYWNTNSFAFNENRYFSFWTLLEESDNKFLIRSIGNAHYPQKRINIVIPIYVHFNIKNEFLQSKYLIADNIPINSKISPNYIPGAEIIKSLEGKVHFYISINPKDIGAYKPDILLILFIIAALFASVFSVQILSIQLSKIYSALIGIGFVSIILLLGNALVYVYGLPFQLSNLEIFSPLIYASNRMLPSFGHLLVHVLSIYWLLSLIVSQAYRVATKPLASKYQPYKWLILLAELLLMLIVCFYIQNIVKSIVFDSSLTFDTNNLDSTNKFTLYAFLIMVLLARILYFKLLLTNIIIKRTIGFSRRNYFFVFLIIFGFTFGYAYLCQLNSLVYGNFENIIWLSIIPVFWGCAFLFYLAKFDFRKNKMNYGLYYMIWVSAYFAIFFAIMINFFVDRKEQMVTRVNYAEKLSKQQNTDFELKIEELSYKIENDSIIRNWFLYSDLISNDEIKNHLKMNSPEIFYFDYTSDIFLVDTNQRSKANGHTFPTDDYIQIKNASFETISKILFFRIDKNEQGAYLLFAPIRNPKDSVLLGYLIIDFHLKLNLLQSFYPKLLINYSIIKNAGSTNYDFAVYNNQQLVSQSGGYDFEMNIDDKQKAGENIYVSNGDYSKLYYKVSKNKSFIIVHQEKKIYNIITLFSFLFILFLLVSSIENWINALSVFLFTGGPFVNKLDKSVSVRIKYFVLGFIGISFFVIGVSTIIFLKSSFDDLYKKNINNTTANLSESISEYIKLQDSIPGSIIPQTVLATEHFSYFLNNIGHQQKIAINIFDIHGRLITSTNSNIFQSNVLSKNISYSAIHKIVTTKVSNFLVPRTVGNLNFTASCAPILNKQKQIIGFMTIPFLNTKLLFEKQIISLITTLIDIYTILILISSLITFLYINKFSRSLQMVSEGLKNVNLNKNELIHWPYKDEIGMLVNEYNKMIAFVEKTAKTLVMDERQNAWREMAQQVAHEIKNPLTPMKLNVQYLQQAINANHPDIVNLTKRVSRSIIEQIDNLNYIASEFSNFAKMPEKHTEKIELKAMIENVLPLFSGNKNLTIAHSLKAEQYFVIADKSQLLRILNNIIQNAVEAFPSDFENGKIDIELLSLENEKFVEIRVTDNGTGIPENLKGKIFDPYFTTKSSGTGLGLAMSKKIIELWGGSISFVSELNAGTTFIIQIPSA